MENKVCILNGDLGVQCHKKIALFYIIETDIDIFHIDITLTCVLLTIIDRGVSIFFASFQKIL